MTLCALALVLGAALIAIGAATYTGAHAIVPVETDGHVANYTEILIGNSYAHNELRLAGDPHTYVLDSRQFHPSLPDHFVQDARITIWVDRGTSNVVALTLYDVMGLNPVTYITPGYDDPTATLRTARTQGEAMAGAGLVLLLLVPVVLVAVWVWRRARTREDSEAPVARGRRVGPLEPLPAPMPSVRMTSPPPIPLAPAPAESAPWLPRPGTGTPPTSGAQAGAVPGWDIGDLPTQKRRAQQAPAAHPPAVDEVPTQKTHAQAAISPENPPPATPS